MRSKSRFNANADHQNPSADRVAAKLSAMAVMLATKSGRGNSVSRDMRQKMNACASVTSAYPQVIPIGAMVKKKIELKIQPKARTRAVAIKGSEPATTHRETTQASALA